MFKCSFLFSSTSRSRKSWIPSQLLHENTQMPPGSMGFVVPTECPGSVSESSQLDIFIKHWVPQRCPYPTPRPPHPQRELVFVIIFLWLPITAHDEDEGRDESWSINRLPAWLPLYHSRSIGIWIPAGAAPTHPSLILFHRRTETPWIPNLLLWREAVAHPTIPQLWVWAEGQHLIQF